MKAYDEKRIKSSNYEILTDVPPTEVTYGFSAGNIAVYLQDSSLEKLTASSFAPLSTAAATIVTPIATNLIAYIPKAVSTESLTDRSWTP